MRDLYLSLPHYHEENFHKLCCSCTVIFRYYRSVISDSGNYHKDSISLMGYPTKLIPLLSSCILYYCNTIAPYLMSGHSHSPYSRYAWTDSNVYIRYIHILEIFGGGLARYMTRSLGSDIETLAERCSSGLMRKEQVQLYEISMDRLHIQLSTLIDLLREAHEAESDKWETVTCLVEEFVRRCRSVCTLFVHLLGSERFRSERLELLLLKHIHMEEPVNLDLLEALDRTQDEHRNLLREFGNYYYGKTEGPPDAQAESRRTAVALLWRKLHSNGKGEWIVYDGFKC